jgi:hypothetical protein
MIVIGMIMTVLVLKAHFMYRENGDLVINDPLCHSNMEDVDDIVNWADEHLPQSRTNG